MAPGEGTQRLWHGLDGDKCRPRLRPIGLGNDELAHDIALADGRRSVELRDPGLRGGEARRHDHRDGRLGHCHHRRTPTTNDMDLRLGLPFHHGSGRAETSEAPLDQGPRIDPAALAVEHDGQQLRSALCRAANQATPSLSSITCLDPVRQGPVVFVIPSHEAIRVGERTGLIRLDAGSSVVDVDLLDAHYRAEVRPQQSGAGH